MEAIKTFDKLIDYLNEKIGSEFDSEEIREFAGAIIMSVEGQLKLCVGGTLSWSISYCSPDSILIVNHNPE